MNLEPRIASQTPTEREEIARRTALPKQYGEAFVTTFYRALKGSVYYEPTNAIFIELLRNCLQTIRSITQTAGTFTIKVVHDACFMNNVRIQPTPDHFAFYKSFIHEMRLLCLGELEVGMALTEATLTGFIFLLRELEPENESNYLLVKQELVKRQWRGIDVGKLEAQKDDLSYTDSEALKRQSKEVYFTSLDLVKELMEDAHHQRVLNVRRAKRLMLNAVNVIMRDESTLLGLANIKSYDDYTFNHSVNVAIYAIALGQRLGLTRKHLNYLGMAGLFHDIGKTGISRDILNKPARLTPEEWAVVQEHPVRGAEIVMGIRGWGELSTRMMTAAFEHHRKYDGSGYPVMRHPRPPSLFSRIITLVDCYDAIGRPRVYRRNAFLPYQILELLLEQSGRDFDPLLVKVFIGMIGVFPLGSLVRLDTGEMAIVSQIPDDTAAIQRPGVLLLRRRGQDYLRGQEVDLNDVDPVTGQYARTILCPLDPAEFGINIEEFFL